MGVGLRVSDIHFEIIIGKFKNTIKLYVEYPMNRTPLKSFFCLTWFMSLQWSSPPMRAFESKCLCKLKTLYISLYIHVCSNWDDAIYDLTLDIVAFENLSLNIKK